MAGASGGPADLGQDVGQHGSKLPDGSEADGDDVWGVAVSWWMAFRPRVYVEICAGLDHGPVARGGVRWVCCYPSPWWHLLGRCDHAEAILRTLVSSASEEPPTSYGGSAMSDVEDVFARSGR